MTAARIPWRQSGIYGFLLPHLLLAAVCKTALCLAFAYPLLLLLLHLPIVASGYLVLIALALALCHLVGSRVAMMVAVPLSIAMTFLLLLLYFVNTISNWSWKTNITFSLLSDLMIDVFQVVPIPLICAMVLVSAALCFALYILYKGLWRRIMAHKPQASRWWLYALAGIVLALYHSFTYMQGSRPYTNDQYDGEVIMDFFSRYTAITGRPIPPPKITVINQQNQGAPLAHKNIIIVVADSMRAHNLSAYGYERETAPFITQLAENPNSRIMRHAFALCAESNCGIAAILQSQPHHSQHPDHQSIHGLLYGSGYIVNFLTAGNHSWGGLMNYYHPRHLHRDGLSFKKHSNQSDVGLLDELRALPDATAGQPSFFYLHLMSSHSSAVRPGNIIRYRPQRNYSIPDAFSMISKYLNLNPSEENINYYDNGILHADHIINQALGILQERGYMDNVQIWILGDHGEELGERGGWGHIDSLYQDQIGIPIIVYDSEGLDMPDLGFATQADIAPTIADSLGLPVPESWQGRSLLSPSAIRTSPTLYVPQRNGGFARLLYLPEQGRIYKYLVERNGARPRMFEIVSDPDEQKDLMGTSQADALVQEYALDDPELPARADAQTP